MPFAQSIKVLSRQGLVGLLGCLAVFASLSLQSPAHAKLNIVTTTGMIADTMRQVAGERADVTALMGVGVDPHAYRQTRSDIARMVNADLVVWHGLYLEAQLEDFMADLAKQKRVVAIAEVIPEGELVAHDDYEGRFDPHVWMDPRLWKQIVAGARDLLIEIDPAGEQTFRTNAARHLGELDRLATYADKAMASVPDSARVLVTAHDAFNYFGKAYGFEVLGIQGISTESEAGIRRIEELVDLLVERQVNAVFVETSVADRNVKALIEGAAARGHTVVIGGELFSDAMGADGTYEGTYLGMIDHNATTIARALGGTAPVDGMNKRLGPES